jgi:hypothetical protein
VVVHQAVLCRGGFRGCTGAGAPLPHATYGALRKPPKQFSTMNKEEEEENEEEEEEKERREKEEEENKPPRFTSYAVWF